LKRVVCEQAQKLATAKVLVDEAMAEVDKLKAKCIDVGETRYLLNTRLADKKKRIDKEKVMYNVRDKSGLHMLTCLLYVRRSLNRCDKITQ
jgi:hypothetical protein